MKGCLLHIIALFLGFAGLVYCGVDDVSWVLPISLIGMAVFLWLLGLVNF